MYATHQLLRQYLNQCKRHLASTNNKPKDVYFGGEKMNRYGSLGNLPECRLSNIIGLDRENPE